jgi:hypothetical protein
MALLCHVYNTTMSCRHHDDNIPFRFRASSSSFVIAHVLHFVLHNLATSPPIVSLCTYAHCQMLSQQLSFFSSAFVVDWLHQYNCCRCFYNTLFKCVHCPIRRSYIVCRNYMLLTWLYKLHVEEVIYACQT